MDGTTSQSGGSETGGANSQANPGQKGGAVKKYNYPLDTDGVNYPHTINIQIFSSGEVEQKMVPIRDLQKDQLSQVMETTMQGQLPRWCTRFY